MTYYYCRCARQPIAWIDDDVPVAWMMNHVLPCQYPESFSIHQVGSLPAKKKARASKYRMVRP